MYDDGLMHIVSTKTSILHCVFRNNFFFFVVKRNTVFFALKLICIQLHLHRIYLYIHTRTRYARKYLTRDYARGSTIYRTEKNRTVSVFKKKKNSKKSGSQDVIKIENGSIIEWEKSAVMSMTSNIGSTTTPPSTAQITKWWLKRFDSFFSLKP